MNSKGSAILKIDSPTLLKVQLGDGESYAVHPLWLRERSPDASSMDLLTGQRLHDPSDLDLDLRLVSVEESAPGQFKVKFSDGHQTQFAASEILAEAAMPPGDQDCPAVTVWDGKLKDLPRANVARSAHRCRASRLDRAVLAIWIHHIQRRAVC